MSIAIFSGLIILVTLVILLMAGMPIAIALAISSIAAILPTLNFDAAVLTGAQRVFSGISIFSLLAIPFFILAGSIMNRGGIASRLIDLAKLVTGRTPGALAQTNVIANMLFGAISGSGTAAASAMGAMIGPVGTTLFVGVKVGQVKIETVFRWLLPYFGAIIVVLLLVTYIPQLSLWLPGLMGYVK